MKRLEVRLADPAVTDLKEIGYDVFQRSLNLKTARAYKARIRDACDKIGDVPYGGRTRVGSVQVFEAGPSKGERSSCIA